jgi:hypothetical protein
MIKQHDAKLLLKREDLFNVVCCTISSTLACTSKVDVKTLFWSRVPGKFINQNTGKEVALSISLMKKLGYTDEQAVQNIGPQFTGTMREWYETLIETINQLSSIKNDAKSFVCYINQDVLTIVESSILYKPLFTSHCSGIINGHHGKIFKFIIDETITAPEIVVTTVVDDTQYVGRVKVLDMNVI